MNKQKNANRFNPEKMRRIQTAIKNTNATPPRTRLVNSTMRDALINGFKGKQSDESDK